MDSRLNDYELNCYNCNDTHFKINQINSNSNLVNVYGLADFFLNVQSSKQVSKQPQTRLITYLTLYY